MRRLLPLLFVLCACRAPAPVAADAGVSSEWFLFEGDGYQVRMPGEPAIGPVQRAESDRAGMAMRAVTWLAPDKKFQFGVVTFEFPTVAGPIAFGSPLYLAVHGRVLSGLNARILSDVAGTWYSLPGHEAVLERPAGPGVPGARIRARLVVKGRRLYFLSAIREPDAPEGWSQRFLDSFQVTAP